MVEWELQQRKDATLNDQESSLRRFQIDIKALRVIGLPSKLILPIDHAVYLRDNILLMHYLLAEYATLYIVASMYRVSSKSDGGDLSSE